MNGNSIEIEHKRRPGPKEKVSRADKHELRRYREAGVSIARLANMYGISTGTVYEILRELRALLGPEQLPEDKRNLARKHLFTSRNNPGSPA